MPVCSSKRLFESFILFKGTLENDWKYYDASPETSDVYLMLVLVWEMANNIFSQWHAWFRLILRGTLDKTTVIQCIQHGVKFEIMRSSSITQAFQVVRACEFTRENGPECAPTWDPYLARTWVRVWVRASASNFVSACVWPYLQWWMLNMTINSIPNLTDMAGKCN